VRFIERHCTRGPGLGQIAAAAGLSRFHFCRTFTQCFGESPKAMLTRLQIEQAKRLMLTGRPLSEIAIACGFVHLSHFSSRFKQVVGQRPSRWLVEQHSAAK
jgi:AraC-like DNA-binding protein